MRLRSLLIPLLCIMLSGCGAVVNAIDQGTSAKGQNFDEMKARRLVVGESRKPDVLELYGPPKRESKKSGVETWSYEYSEFRKSGVLIRQYGNLAKFLVIAFGPNGYVQAASLKITNIVAEGFTSGPDIDKFELSKAKIGESRTKDILAIYGEPQDKTWTLPNEESFKYIRSNVAGGRSLSFDFLGGLLVRINKPTS